MRNKDGQTLVFFILLIPLFLLIAAFAIDSSLMINENIKLKSTTKTIIKETLINNYNEEQTKQLFKENKIKISELQIEIKENEVRVANHYFIESIFAKVIGIKNYEMKIDITGTKVGDKIEF